MHAHRPLGGLRRLKSMSTDTCMTQMTDDRRAKRNVAVLVAAQAILGAQLPMIFVIGGLAGGMLSPNPYLATLRSTS